MTLKESKQVIDEFLAQGEKEENIVGALYVMYQEDDINLEELEKLIGLLGYEFTEEFKNMSDEDKKTKGYEEADDEEKVEDEEPEIETMVNPVLALKMKKETIIEILVSFYTGGDLSYLEGNKYIKDYLDGNTIYIPDYVAKRIKNASSHLKELNDLFSAARCRCGLL